MAWEDRGKLIKGSRKQEKKLHRFSFEVITSHAYENFVQVEREFYDRKTNRSIANINNRENVLYINTNYKDKKEYQASINEAKRLTKAEKFSEFIPVFL